MCHAQRKHWCRILYSSRAHAEKFKISFYEQTRHPDMCRYQIISYRPTMIAVHHSSCTLTSLHYIWYNLNLYWHHINAYRADNIIILYVGYYYIIIIFMPCIISTYCYVRSMISYHTISYVVSCFFVDKRRRLQQQ